MSSTETITAHGTWTLDPVHSSVGFEVRYLAGTFRGSFRDVDGTLELGDGRATLHGAARVESVDVKDANLATHLQSPEFFDAEQHPELRFRADDVRLDGESAEVLGEITIKGVTRPLVATGTASGPLTDAFGTERVGLSLQTTVDRTAFGVSWNVPLPTGAKALSDEVTILADLYFVRA